MVICRRKGGADLQPQLAHVPRRPPHYPLGKRAQAGQESVLVVHADGQAAQQGRAVRQLPPVAAHCGHSLAPAQENGMCKLLVRSQRAEGPTAAAPAAAASRYLLEYSPLFQLEVTEDVDQHLVWQVSHRGGRADGPPVQALHR